MSARYSAEILNSTIIALGHFNPAIFSPDWLEKNGLIGGADADSVRDGSLGKPLVVSHQVSAFETKWFALQVLENQFSLTSKDALTPALKDLCAGIFQLVPHTPVTAVGLNFLAHFRLNDESEYHRVGDVIAPKTIWNELYPDSAAGLGDLQIRIQPCKRGEVLDTKDEKRITVQPSGQIKCGVFLAYNDHHDLTSTVSDNLKPGERVAKVVDTFWELAWKDALRVFEGVLTRALAGH